MNTKLSFIGAGAMAEALINGWRRKGFLKGEQITISNKSNDDQLAKLVHTYQVQSTRKPENIISPDSMIILACKPKDWKSALSNLTHLMNENTPLISVMAGVSLSVIEQFVGNRVPVIRVMPNTSATVGASMTTIAYGKNVDPSIRHDITQLFNGVGETAEVDEAQLDATTALTGSGPAYVYYLIESMEMAAKKMGIEEQLAKKLVSQTLLGASLRAKECNEDPGQLYKQVMSPGGTTEAGFQVLQNNNVQQSLISCILSACERSLELKNEKSS
ncbi:pyrroline-5-carboxylate reductase [Evansella cellulosilytica]|uniref:Pyrroline-5-carboxylate reductase n=1 Tax=Evansella cellulosilytica (strain ATCC 21833 / DSM 2522 / FERM P-1141 / JCM 9156 / N-4) TaxID=649639 RepID=E6TXV2_EVAC2|nr:pyrroline-5-carboxylate reductase [Evansella cellulosilytica]ADU30028.1 pyrroline-5-carboxylate reductase [Evansella cellulosilytica DSM 2522]